MASVPVRFSSDLILVSLDPDTGMFTGTPRDEVIQWLSNNYPESEMEAKDFTWTVYLPDEEAAMAFKLKWL